MVVRINRRAIFQYLLIYLAFMLNDSYLYKNFIINYNFALFLLLLLIVFIYKKMRLGYVILFLVFSMACVLFERLLSGGVGLDVWLRWAVPILCTLCAITLDEEHFLHRWVKMVTFMAGISIVFWLITLINVDFIRNIMLFHYEAGTTVSEWLSSTEAIYQTEYADGLFFYAVRFSDVIRNNGVFSEPGLYQMTLNSTLFILFFLKDKLMLSDKQRLRSIIIITIAILTCQSASGFLSLIFIICVYLMENTDNESAKIRRRVLTVVLLAVGFLLIEYLINGTESVLYSKFVLKLFSNGNFDLTSDTGVWRIYTITTAWKSMINNPLGIGYSAANELLLSGSVGAQIFITGAALGVIPFIVFQLWTLYPVFKTREIKILEKIVIIFMYYNSMLAQSKDFYPAFLIFTIYFVVTGRLTEKQDDFEKYYAEETEKQEIIQKEGQQ